MTDTLTAKQQAFIDHYITTKNAVEAARLAGYAGDYASLGVIGSNNLKKAKIKAVIAERYRDNAMDSNEALALLADHARGPDFNALAAVFVHDTMSGIMRAIAKYGLGPLVKKVSQTRAGFSVEFYDAQTALNMILRALGAYNDSLDLTVYGVELGLLQELLTQFNQHDISASAVFNDLLAQLAEAAHDSA